MGIVSRRPTVDYRQRGRSIHPAVRPFDEETIMASASTEGVYRVIDVVGSSDTSWEDAARHAVETASKSLRDLRIAEVTKLDVKIENGKVLAYRTRLQLSFKYEG
jgi:dodecin